MKKNIIPIFLFLILINSCCLFNSKDCDKKKDKIQPIITIKNSIVLHKGLYPKSVFTKGVHKLNFEMKSTKDFEIDNITYIIKNPENKIILKNTYKPEINITLLKNYNYENITFETDKYGPGELCQQFQAMADTEGELFVNTVDIIVLTKAGETFTSENNILQFEKDKWYKKVIKAIAEYGCNSLLWIKEVFT